MKKRERKRVGGKREREVNMNQLNKLNTIDSIVDDYFMLNFVTIGNLIGAIFLFRRDC